ncbi:Major membrane immunogen, membrane-anchored lipoprotein [Atopostipes suicloacalis DSM 15692]|uniref:Major membrane immunogen, membrane-anchored lipoprotein n=1 Tax=Atopostipes suicloacalis DSM 15692 TaxID=1121025 RepID=A0A1M4YA44_9LACT|nr:FMN-binding protein [Atopostipes suicloacalis]SHF02503.1 Major membrane immunogen, membrane-anchored lipoprotein [Atopostipes suicloacalis DSM 15692]
MKKFLSVLFLSSALVLTGCGNEEAPEETPEDTAEDVQDDTTVETTEGLQDGSYRVEDLNFGETGWKEALEVTVADGEITEATWESKDEDGNDKIDDEDYQETMTNVDGLGPQDFIPDLEGQLVEKQDPADVEVVSGATHTSEKFQDYAQQLVDAAEEGNTETIEVDNAE